MKSHLYFITFVCSIFCFCNRKPVNETLNYIKVNFPQIKLSNNDTLIVLLDNQCLNCIRLENIKSNKTFILSNAPLEYLKNFPIEKILYTKDVKLTVLKEIDYQNCKFIYKNNKLELLSNFNNITFFK